MSLRNVRARPKLACDRASSQATRVIATPSILRQWVQIAHQALEPLLQHMRVDLRGRDVGVAKQRLHHAEVGAVLQEVAGERMAQHVRADLRSLQAGGAGELLQFAREMLAGQMPAFAERWEQPFGPVELARGA